MRDYFLDAKLQNSGGKLSDTVCGITIEGETVSQASNAVGTKKSAHLSALLKSAFFLKVYHSLKREAIFSCLTAMTV